jgi:8-oxo-dGTP pyrophosphatase MutT (NUDIX family)
MESFVNFLEAALKRELPGQVAQEQMMPSLSDKTRFSLAAKATARPGAVMVLFYQKNGELMIPLIERAHYDGVHAGQISFPGGKMDTSDKDLTHTALRETEEEIGVPSSRIKLLGSLTELYILASNFNVLPVVGYVEGEPPFHKDDHEVASIVEARVADLLKDNVCRQKTLTVRNHLIEAPYFDINGHVVWGATAMMLSELKVILKQDHRLGRMV